MMEPQSQALKLQAGGFLSVNILLLWSVALSWLSPWMTWMAAVPLVILWFRQAPALVKGVSLSSWMALLFLLNRELFVTFLIFGVFVGGLIALCYSDRVNLSGALAVLIVASVALIGILWAAKVFWSFDLVGDVIKSYDRLVALAAAEAAKGKMQAWVVPSVTAMRDSAVYWVQTLPGAVIFLSFLAFFISNSLVAGAMLRREAGRPRVTFSFLEARLDFFFVWILIASWTGLFISHELKNQALNGFFLNAVYILAACFGLQGAAVMLALFRSFPFPNWVRIFIAILLFGFWPRVAAVMVCGIGLLDEWFHFRKIKIDIGGKE